MSGKLDNVIVFPGAENKQVEDVKKQEEQVLKRLKETQHKINSFVSIKDYQLQCLQGEVIVDLAQYGDVMTFTPIAARRLIKVLADEVLSLNGILNDLEEKY